MGRGRFGRRRFLAGTGVATFAAVSAPVAAVAAGETRAAEPSGVAAAAKAEGYAFFKPAEAYFIEAIADHMIPADELSPSGSDLGIPVYIDRALAGAWGKGDRLYMQGPWLTGTANQGYQLPLTPAELYRAAIPACDAFCKQMSGKVFAAAAISEKEAFLKDLAAGKAILGGGVPGRTFFSILYGNVIEGMFSDPIYGGNKDKAGWKMIGFPGVMANNAENVKIYQDGRRFTAEPVSIADMS
jgi:gluconate 2-dehydrogenase gamma chain